MKYIFGPVPSRRLGRSLGISPIPPKTCNFSCVYCQLGRTSNFTNTREMFYPPEELLEEAKEALKQDKEIDFITIVGDGEPTLYAGLGELIIGIKKITSIPIAVITNGALLYRKDVRTDLLKADVVLPTLDAPNQQLFKIINRPRKELDLNKIIEGMRSFKEEYTNQLWLEVMIVKDKNDNPEILTQIKKIIDKIGFDKVFINAPIRPPAEKWVEIPSLENLQNAKEILEAEDISHYEEVLIENVDKKSDSEQRIIEITQRHPLREEQVYSLFPELNKKEIDRILNKMEEKGIIYSVVYNEKIFWKISKNR